MVNINIDEDTLVEMLVKRVHAWTDDEDIIDLFEQYYENMVYGGYFEDADLDVKSIVDNDYVSNTSIITREEFEEARSKYIEKHSNKLEKEEIEEDTPTWEDLERGENTLEFLDGSYIEAKTEKCILVSW